MHQQDHQNQQQGQHQNQQQGQHQNQQQGRQTQQNQQPQLPPQPPPMPPQYYQQPQSSGPIAVVKRVLKGEAERIDRLEGELEKLRVENQHLKDESRALGERLGMVNSAINALRSDLTSEQDRAHETTAHSYGLLCQDVRSAALGLMQSCGLAHDNPETPDVHADVAARIFRSLLGPLPPLPSDLALGLAPALGRLIEPDERLAGLCQAAGRLREEVQRNGGVHRWDFEVPVGMPFDAERFGSWHSEDEPGAMVCAVAPGYQVLGRRPHALPLVHTQR
jgi:hypothetical protein